MSQKHNHAKQPQNEKLISWNAPEFEKYERTKGWYTIAIIAAALMLLFAFFTANFLFAVIIIVVALIVILHDGREPERVKMAITDEGVIVGKRFFDYDDLKNFSIVYKPRIGVKNLYFEFKNIVRPRLSIPLENMNPLPIREILLKYLPEDMERTDEPLSEALTRLFKL